MIGDPFTMVVAIILIVTVGILISLAFLLLADRKIWAGVQMRKGPNVVGPFGLLQSFADFFKFVLKEIIVPAGADKVVFLLAPLLTFVLAFIAWAAIPFAPGWVISDLNVGILYTFGIVSLGDLAAKGDAHQAGAALADISEPARPTRIGLAATGGGGGR